jgi:hypothetical protein
VYDSALEVINKWKNQEFIDTEFLHHLCYVAYGLDKRDFSDESVVWPGNMTPQHEPISAPLLVQINDELYTIYFKFDGTEWKTITKPGAEFIKNNILYYQFLGINMDIDTYMGFYDFDDVKYEWVDQDGQYHREYDKPAVLFDNKTMMWFKNDRPALFNVHGENFVIMINYIEMVINLL